MQHWKSGQYCICARGGDQVRERERQHTLKDCWDLDLKTRYYDARCATVSPAVHIVLFVMSWKASSTIGVSLTSATI